MQNFKPLDDLEMFELPQVAYPEKFPGDDDKTWDAAQEFAETMSGFDEIAELLGRVAQLTMPMSGGMSNTLSHCLGTVRISEGKVNMVAAVRRPAA